MWSDLVATVKHQGRKDCNYFASIAYIVTLFIVCHVEAVLLALLSSIDSVSHWCYFGAVVI